jgi:PilZ domain
LGPILDKKYMATISVMQTSWSALKGKDMRRYPRYAVDSGILQISWLDTTGKLKMARTRAINISEGGMAIELPEAAMSLSMVRFQSDRFKTRGQGVVRHCRRVGSRFIVGLEFTEGLRWRAPEGEIQEPVPICDPYCDR